MGLITALPLRWLAHFGEDETQVLDALAHLAMGSYLAFLLTVVVTRRENHDESAHNLSRSGYRVAVPVGRRRVSRGLERVKVMRKARIT